MKDLIFIYFIGLITGYIIGYVVHDQLTLEKELKHKISEDHLDKMIKELEE